MSLNRIPLVVAINPVRSIRRRKNSRLRNRRVNIQLSPVTDGGDTYSLQSGFVIVSKPVVRVGGRISDSKWPSYLPTPWGDRMALRFAQPTIRGLSCFQC